jgi:GDSL-like Lipase/Acylhydrolase family
VAPGRCSPTWGGGSSTLSRRILLPLLSLAIGSIVALSALEIAFRVLGLRKRDPGRIFRITNGPDVHFPGRAGHEVVDLYASNPRGSFPVDLRDERTRDDLIRRRFARVDEARARNPFGVPFSYNARGYRDREFAKKPAGVRRVVFVGDSFVEAQGVVEGSSAVRLVEQALRRDGSAVEVWNLGVRGHDFPDLEEVFEAAFELEPDVLIYGMVLNDVERDPSLTKNLPRVNDWIMVRERKPSWLERHSYLASFVRGRYETRQVTRDTTAWYRALYTDENQAGWTRTRAAWVRIKARCESRGVVFGVALWPLLVGLEDGATYPFEDAHAQIRRGVARAQIPFVDLLPVLRGRSTASLWVHESDLHPNEIAQELVAPVLARFVGDLAVPTSRRPFSPLPTPP